MFNQIHPTKELRFLDINLCDVCGCEQVCMNCSKNDNEPNKVLFIGSGEDVVLS